MSEKALLLDRSDLTVANVAATRARLLKEKPAAIDLSAVARIDGAGLQLLLSFQAAQGQKIKLLSATESVRKLLQSTGAEYAFLV